MLRRLSVIAAAVAMLGVTALPASAATATHPVKVTVCAKDTSRRTASVAVAVGVAFSKSGKIKNLDAVAIGYRHSSCRTITTTYTAHL